MRDFALVGLMSTYREGPLAVNACRSLLDAHLDRVIVWEGPAGPERCEDAPATSIGAADGEVTFREGRWESDAAKRTGMLRYAVRQFPGRPVWAVLLDGDEILVNGRHMRDLIQCKMWEDEARGASLTDPDNLPTGGIPLRLVEHDATCAFAFERLLRLDTLRRFVVSNLIVETVFGNEMRIGHVPETLEAEARMRQATIREAAEKEWEYPRRLVAPPLPGEACIVHRSHLRHPARRPLRLHKQELSELERLGLPV